MVTDEHAWAIFRQGYSAFVEGKNRAQCPFSGLADADAWMTGFESAKFDKEVDGMVEPAHAAELED